MAMLLLYNLAIALYHLSINIAALCGNIKAKHWLSGRRNQASSLAQHTKKSFTVWIHIASLGEYEQALPLINELSQYNPNIQIVISFFSPSGFKNFKPHASIAQVYYLPLDTKTNAQNFIECVKPDLAIMVKYEFWFHYLNTLRQNNVPIFLISGVIRPKPFMRWYGGVHRRMLQSFTHFFVQNDESANVLKQLGFSNYTVAGDTRYAQVLSTSKTEFMDDIIASFCKRYSKIIVCGSTWPVDEKILSKAILQLPDYGFIIAPHEVTNRKLKNLQHLFSDIRYYTAEQNNSSRILVLDTMGKLKFVYKFAQICYVGGGFGAGIHNILEAAVYGKAVITGPKIQKFTEALTLQKIGALRVIKDENQFVTAVQSFSSQCTNTEQILKEHFAQNTNTLPLIMSLLGSYLPAS